MMKALRIESLAEGDSVTPEASNLKIFLHLFSAAGG
jgi:hypothetical protein